MRQLQYDEVRKIKQDILDRFDAFCSKNGIRYSIAYGTMLGAVRHKGWIPWDDDIDVTMLREDFERLFELYNNEKETRYKLVNNRTDKTVHTKIGYMYDERTHTRPRNVSEFSGFNAMHIDIYPLDIVPENKLMRSLFMQYARFLSMLAKACDIKPGNPGNTRSRCIRIIASIVWVLMLPFNASFFIKRLHTVANRYNNKYAGKDKQNTTVTMLCTNLRQRPIIPYDCMSEYMIIAFEDKKYPIITRYDEYLRSRYGDYMKLPPVEQRVPYTFNSEYYFIDVD